jgi:hypothetical protein
MSILMFGLGNSARIPGNTTPRFSGRRWATGRVGGRLQVIHGACSEGYRNMTWAVGEDIDLGIAPVAIGLRSGCSRREGVEQ